MDYVVNTAPDKQQMLETLGLKNEEALFSHLPDGVKLKRELNLPAGKDELDVLTTLREIADKNTVYDACFLGAGVYDHFIPSVVSQIGSREEFVTSYTPYQAELSQGTLQSIFEYQTMMCDLTGLDVSNASVYDGATAIAEAVMMCVRGKKETALVSEAINPEYMRVLKTWAEYCEFDLKTIPVVDYKTDLDALKKLMDDNTGAVVIQSPNFFGTIEDMHLADSMIHDGGAAFIAAVNPISLAVLACPKDYHADIAAGEGQPLGIPMACGGPYLGFMTATEKMMRKLPGRIVGQTIDTDGNRGFVLTLQAREQHIRREKASSNICSNQALNALRAGAYLAAMGGEGLAEVAQSSMYYARLLKEKLLSIKDVSAPDQIFFNEFVVEIDCDHKALAGRLKEDKVLGGLYLGDNKYIYCATEKTREADIEKLVNAVKAVCHG